MSEQLNDERAAFLAWHNDRRSSIRNAWTAWQARAALTTHHAAPGAPQQEASGGLRRIGFVRFDGRAVKYAAVDVMDVMVDSPIYIIDRAAATASAGGVTETLLDEAVRIMDALVAKSDTRVDRNQEIYDVQQWKAKARAALTPAARAAEPEGWKLVPIEPTPEMLAAFKSAYKEGDFWRERVHGALCAMLAASPTPPTGTSKGGGHAVTTRTYMPILGTPLAIRMDMLNEQWAQNNHGQPLDRLAERGGLAPSEALAIIKRRKWHSYPNQQGIEALAGLQAFAAKATPQGPADHGR